MKVAANDKVHWASSWASNVLRMLLYYSASCEHPHRSIVGAAPVLERLILPKQPGDAEERLNTCSLDCFRSACVGCGQAAFWLPQGLPQSPLHKILAPASEPLYVHAVARHRHRGCRAGIFSIEPLVGNLERNVPRAFRIILIDLLAGQVGP